MVYHLHGFLEAETPAGGGAGLLHVLAGHGYRGVNLFYVLSGFILGLPFAEHRLKGNRPVSLPSYFLRRLTRLEPPYFLNLLVCSALLLAAGQTIGPLWPHTIASALYLHNLWFGGQSTINPVAWSLEIEIQFYILAPLLAGVFSIGSRVARRAALVALIVLAGAVQLFYWDAGPRAKLSILFAVQFFLTGFLLADLYLDGWRERWAASWLWDIAALGGWLAMFALEDAQVWLVLPFLMAFVFAAAFRGALMNCLFQTGAVVTIGGMCYTIYLWHYVLIPPVLRSTSAVLEHSRLRWCAQSAAYLAGLLFVSGCYFVLIERPCMDKNWPNRAAERVRRAFTPAPRLAR